MSVKLKVTFPHKDSTGTKRKVGEVYTAPEAEAKVRVDRDHFAVRVEDKPSTPAKKADNK